MGTLFLVATPIGNLEDISQRAIKTLKQVRLIACEDTRHSRKLLTHYHITTPVTSYFEHNKYSKLQLVLDELTRGDVALISDAGTPALNDPGYELVISALNNGHHVSPIPGACAPIAALTASGLPSDSFLYLGYLPRKTSERRQRLAQVSNYPFTLILLEAPHRLLGCLKDLAETMGSRNIAVARELTKIHEEIFRDNIDSAIQYFSEHEPRGEFTLVLEGKYSQKTIWTKNELLNWIKIQLEAGHSASKIAASAAQVSGWQRRNIYALINEFHKNQKSESTCDTG
ncbi:MAG: 16S rRNA (cytidine(1402)-2'-O)-methyltransferase [Chloroflexi bacterium]|nr:16S rRNA (cytidine(1402)-2'-O)-methyltransferase [Chloroflexota bacterium]